MYFHKLTFFYFIALACNQELDAAIVQDTPNVIDAADDYCCDFETDACGFTKGIPPGYWQWSKDGVHPNGTIFPFFNHSSNFMFSQNDNSAITTSPLITNVVATTRFVFNYYAHIEDRQGSSSLLVYFLPVGGNEVLLDVLGDTKEGWLRHEITCEDLFCCPSGYPCQGNISITARVIVPYALYAFDDVGLNDGCTALTTAMTTNTPTATASTGTTPTPFTATTASTPTESTVTEITTTETIPPPAPDCCRFAPSTCGFDYADPPVAGYWTWSGDGYSPTSTLFPNFPADSALAYIFTENDNGAVTKSSVFVVESSTVFEITYYAHIEAHTGSNSILVYFERMEGTTVLLDVLGDTNEEFVLHSLPCATFFCCAEYPCNGYVRFEARILSDNELYAISEVEINNACAEI